MNLPKVSIITVVYNDKIGLEKTIKSVINQTYPNIEFIVIDGNSTDGTINVIEQYQDKIDYWISEKDNGIYDAMNKGICVTNGEWINFMNAGDSFIDKNVLNKITFQEYDDYVLLYGNKIQNDKIVYPLNIKKLEVGEIMACHQAMFFNKKKLKNKLYYNLKYKIYADYELVNRIYIKYRNKIKYINKIIVDFKGGGISSRISYQRRKDKYIILFKYYGVVNFLKSITYRLLKNV